MTTKTKDHLAVQDHHLATFSAACLAVEAEVEIEHVMAAADLEDQAAAAAAATQISSMLYLEAAEIEVVQVKYSRRSKFD